MAPSSLRIAVAAIAILTVHRASADDTIERRAADAYDRGTRAHERGDLATAAAEFARADELAPNPVALQAAFEDAIAADDARLGAELLERASTRPKTAALTPLLTDAARRFAGRTGRVRVTCPTTTPCIATADGRRIATGVDVIDLVGRHEIVVTFDAATLRRIVEVKPDATALVSAALAPPPPPAAEPRRGLSPAWFGVSVGVTAIAAGVSTWSGVDALAIHGRFSDASCGSVGSARCDELRSDGLAAQTRTNVLVATTMVALLATVVVAVFTAWK